MEYNSLKFADRDLIFQLKKQIENNKEKDKEEDIDHE